VDADYYGEHKEIFARLVHRFVRAHQLGDSHCATTCSRYQALW
jgi:hypothetical protein